MIVVKCVILWCWNDNSLHPIFFIFFPFYLEHKRRLITWLVIHQVEIHFRGREIKLRTTMSAINPHPYASSGWNPMIYMGMNYLIMTSLTPLTLVNGIMLTHYKSWKENHISTLTNACVAIKCYPTPILTPSTYCPNCRSMNYHTLTTMITTILATWKINQHIDYPYF